MASTDWNIANNSLSAGTVDRGVTSGIARPNGGGNFVFGFNSIASTEGAVAYHATQAGYAPLPKGGSIRAALQRGVSGGPLNFSAFLYLCATGNDVNDDAYMLGLSDDDPHRIVLCKGRISDGIPGSGPGVNGVLARSNATFPLGTWKHLRLDVIVNLNEDVILRVFQNDLGAAPVTAPVWTPVPGIGDFVDDALGVNAGSQPLTSGYAGFGFATKDITRRAYLDHLELSKQV